jgi:hypothetical protein
MPNFSRGGAKVPKHDFFTASLLDDATKEDLCRDLLAEFGARNVQRSTSKGEIIHSCMLPFGAHRNGDSKPSASLNFKKLTFNCLGCGAQGGLLWFIAVCRGDDNELAARGWLGERTGLGGTLMEKDRLLKVLDGIFSQQATLPSTMPVFPAATMDPWTYPRPHPYMTDTGSSGGITCRGIPEENCKKFGIGYAEKYPMGSYLDERTDRWIERPPQERIVIPIRWEGKLVGWQARAINPADEPKYKNSVDFPRDRVLYGWEPRQDIVLVESPMSVLRHCHHQPMVASFGKQLTDIQLRILQQAHSITMWFDPDNAGWKGTERAIMELKRYVPMKVVVWPYRDTDPADLDDVTVDQAVADAVPWALWKRPDTLMDWEG